MQFKLFSLFAILATSQAVQANPIDARADIVNVVVTINQLTDSMSRNDLLWANVKVANFPQSFPDARDGFKRGGDLAVATSKACKSAGGTKFIKNNQAAVCDSIYSYSIVQIKVLKTLSSRRTLLRVDARNAEIKVSLRNIGDVIENLKVNVLVPAKCDKRVRSKFQELTTAFVEVKL